MPKYTKFNPDWLNKTDSDGINVNKWLKQGENTSTFKCILCKTGDLDCSNQDNTERPIVLDFQEQITKVEAIWALTVAQRGYSFNSCDEIGDVFRHMFPDSKIAQEFSMQSRKTSYVLSHGLGPYFHQELIKSLKRNEKFVLCFDEQTNNQDRKQLDLLVKYWCFDEGLVVTRGEKLLLFFVINNNNNNKKSYCYQ
ncbi:unnamed protein product [Rotaria sp. Silwood1]|nr:unnamed protein product [Rotaria sp. Silwood1]